MEEQGEQAPCQQTDHVNDQEFCRVKPTDHNVCKKIQCEHVHEQMGEVDMQKSRCDHAFPLSGLDSPYLKLVALEKSRVVESTQGNQQIGRDDPNCYCTQCHEWYFFARQI